MYFILIISLFPIKVLLNSDEEKEGVAGEHCLLVEMPLISYQMPDLKHVSDNSNQHNAPPPLIPRLMHLEIQSNTIPTVQPAKSRK